MVNTAATPVTETGASQEKLIESAWSMTIPRHKPRNAIAQPLVRITGALLRIIDVCDAILVTLTGQTRISPMTGRTAGETILSTGAPR